MKKTPPLPPPAALPHRLLRLLRNKYALTSLLFIAWLTFFDGHSLLERATVARNTRRLERQAAYYAQRVKDNHRRLHELRTDNDNLEKHAREQYLMKRSDEDVFIVVSQ